MTVQTCLSDKEWIFAKFYEEMYTAGIINNKTTFNSLSVPVNVNRDGFPVKRDHQIHQENCQRSKILSSEVQIAERRAVVYDKQMEQYQKQNEYYDMESKDYAINTKCKAKLVSIISEETTTPSDQDASTYRKLQDLTDAIINANKSSLHLNKLKAFVKVRSEAIIKNGKCTFKNIPTLKDDLLCKVVAVAKNPVDLCFYKVHPTMPTSDAMNGNDAINGADDNEMDRSS